MAPGKIFLMTDKAETKDCACTFPGCLNFCRVNKFYAPAKAKCPDHGGVATKMVGTADAMRFEEQAVTVVQTVEAPPATPNHRLRALMCPVCDSEEPLEILAVTEGGHIDFGCQGCQTITAITFNFRSAQLRSIPERLAPLVKQFNVKQVGSMDLAVSIRLSRFSSLDVQH